MADRIDREIAIEALNLSRSALMSSAANLEVNIRIHDLTILILNENINHSRHAARLNEILEQILNEIKELRS